MGKKEDIATNLAALVKKYRENTDLIQDNVAEKLNVSRQLISAYETEKVDVPAWCLINFAMLYNIPLEEILFALCNNEEEIKYVKDHFPKDDDPTRNLLIKYLQDKMISYEDAEFLYENDKDGQAIRIALNFQKAVHKEAGKENKKSK